MQVRRPFRLLNVVMQQEDFKALTRSIWQQQVPGYKMYSIWRKLSNIAGQAKGLQKEMSVVDKIVDDYKTRLNQVQKGLKSASFNQELIVEERQILHNIEYWETICHASTPIGAQIFLLPKKITNVVTIVCRTFL
ncbi:hypothetical protein FXO38_05677 [Capsicum annuum]|nr:hypothetical protein FXO38_05677 [Capsicum annuum]KAF3685938.1 hypothetical protein FXO37_00123 [Capsicum annuum]